MPVKQSLKKLFSYKSNSIHAFLVVMITVLFTFYLGAAYFLSKASPHKKGQTLFIFDEPTTGLHFHDIKKLLKSFQALIERGHTIICVEHNMDVIKSADWVIDMGPEAGELGGNIVFEGTPEGLAKSGKGYTSDYLKEKMKLVSSKK